jgi:pimeloyl-ACP methyl ester carboxylesterase
MKINFLQANGLSFAYYEQGKGPLLLCLHGFPDTADTWLDLIPSLVNAGYRVVAPFMRGYYPTEIPSNASYSSLDLANDVVALI